jgi:hypothetical protein
MNLDRIESALVPSLKRFLGRKIEVVAGPVFSPPLGGMQPMVFVHAQSFEDGGGVTPEGARTARRPVSEKRNKGYAEERPGRILLEITVLARVYDTVKRLCHGLSPFVLRALAAEEEYPVGELKNRSVRLAFADFEVNIGSAAFDRVEEAEVVYHAGRLTFRLDGYLHSWVTNRGGLVRRPPAPVGTRTTKTPAKTTAKKTAKKTKPAKTKPAKPTMRRRRATGRRE